MLLLIRFYNFWREENYAPTEALRQAQQWQRDTTNGEKLAYFRGLMQNSSISKTSISTVDHFYKALVLSRPGDRDFAHPFRWAAFNYVAIVGNFDLNRTDFFPTTSITPGVHLGNPPCAVNGCMQQTGLVGRCTKQTDVLLPHPICPDWEQKFTPKVVPSSSESFQKEPTQKNRTG